MSMDLGNAPVGTPPTAGEQAQLRTAFGLGGLATANSVAISSQVTGLGANVATALAVSVGSVGSFAVIGGALGTPSSCTLTNATGLPLSGLAQSSATNGQVPTWNGSAWSAATPTGGGGSPAGADGDIQIKSGTAFASGGAKGSAANVEANQNLRSTDSPTFVSIGGNGNSFGISGQSIDYYAIYHHVWHLASGGMWLINNGPLVPRAANLQDLGSPEVYLAKWRHLYLSGTANVLHVDASGIIKSGSFTVATLPASAGAGMVTGAICTVTDAESPAIGSAVASGGGTDHLVTVQYNGTNWIIIAILT